MNNPVTFAYSRPGMKSVALSYSLTVYSVVIAMTCQQLRF